MRNEFWFLTILANVVDDPFWRGLYVIAAIWVACVQFIYWYFDKRLKP